MMRTTLLRTVPHRVLSSASGGLFEEALAQVPDLLTKQVEELARQEKVSVCQLVSIALACQVSAWQKRHAISERAKRGNWEKFDRVMAKVRDVPPLPGDEK